MGLTEIMGNTGVLSAESGFYDIGEPERQPGADGDERLAQQL